MSHLFSADFLIVVMDKISTGLKELMVSFSELIAIKFHAGEF